MSEIRKNQFFLKTIDKTQMLDQLIDVEAAFGGKYNKRAFEYVCGERLRECTAAYRDWASTLEKRLDQLIEDGSHNEYEGLDNLGYNIDKMKSTLEKV